jgi:hypothetical protein
MYHTKVRLLHFIVLSGAKLPELGVDTSMNCAAVIFPELTAK